MTADIGTIEVAGSTRADFLLRGALGASAALGAGAAVTLVSRALGKSGDGDLEIVKFALTLEYLQAGFYEHSLKLALSVETRAVARELHDHEVQHVAALETAVRKLGGTPPTVPVFVFPDHDESAFIRLAQALEDTGISAYNGAAPRVASAEILAEVGAIVQVEGRHSAIVRLLRERSPAPDAFDAALDESRVIATVRPLFKA